MAEIDPRFIVQIKGRDICLYAGALDAATREGLTSLTTKLLQAPTADNGNLAIVEAVAVFGQGEETRVFSDLGEASPASVGQQFAGCLVRMAATRSKKRALSDALNIAELLLDEQDDDSHGAPATAYARRAEARPPEVAAAACAICNVALTVGQKEVSLRAFGKPLCPTHQRAQAASPPPPPPEAEESAPPSEERGKLLAFWTRLQGEAKALGLGPPVLSVQGMSDHDLAAVIKEWNERVESTRKKIAARPAA